MTIKGSVQTDKARRDGRHARSERTRRRVAEAMLDCLEEGLLRPTARDVADRAGVSERGVFRHFDNLRALLETAADIQSERILRALPPVVVEGPLEDRIEAIVRHSARRNELIAPVRRAALLAEPDSPLIRERLDWLRGEIRRQLRRVFAEELAALPDPERRRRIAALRALLSFAYWDELRRHEKLSVATASRVLREALVDQIGRAPAAATSAAARPAKDAPILDRL